MDYDRNTPILVLLSVWFYGKKMKGRKMTETDE
jgi:ABC-type amino acid transport system permease subunit